MEYNHGQRVTLHVHEMSPLERAIIDFENQAKKAHSYKQAPQNETPEQRKERERSLDKALTHLKAQRALALTQVQVQVQLEEYRAALQPDKNASRQDKKVARQAMALEKHHPTDTLAKFMKVDGRPQPSPRFTAHHIVQGKGKTQYAAQTRIDLHFNNIRINDPDNGVWMPRHKTDKGHWAMPHAAAHSEIHTHNYEHWVNSRTTNIIDEQAFRSQLSAIRALLRDGNQPEYVTEPPLKRDI